MRNNVAAMDDTLKDLMRRNMIFGGSAILFPEGFRPILPVVQRGCRARSSASCFTRSLVIPLLNALLLATNVKLLAFQQVADIDENAVSCPKFFLDVSNGMIPQTEDYKIELPFSINRKNTIQDLCGGLL